MGELSKPLRFPHKKVRSQVIAEYVRAAGYRGVVVFSCGNSADALREQGLEVVEVGPRGDLDAKKWWTMAEIHRAWPDLFDATSGHLPVPLMGDIAKAFRAYLGDLPAGRYSVASGSGETVTCLRIVYPFVTFDPAYDNSKPETTRSDDAPLNAIVDGDSTNPRTEEEKAEYARMWKRYGQHVSSLPSTTDATKRRGSALLGFGVMVAAVVLAVFITVLVMR